MKKNRRRQRKALLTSVVALGTMTGAIGLVTRPSSVYASQAPAASPSSLQNAFQAAAKEFHVPVSVLMSVAYNESLWDQHPGQPSVEGGYGVMYLTQLKPPGNGKGSAKGNGNGNLNQMAAASGQTPAALDTLDTAAQLLNEDPNTLKVDFTQNVRGGAALLAQYEKSLVGGTPSDAAQWYGAVAEYSGSTEAAVAEQFANDVYATINSGATRDTAQGQHVVLSAESVQPDKSTLKPLHLRNTKQTGADAPNGLAVQYIPALYEQFSSSPYNYGNYDLANRPSDGLDIRYIIIHDAEGTYDQTINTFLAHSYVSANYVVNSQTGAITEMVRPQNVAWQAGNWYINTHSIGIEHSGYAVQGGTWYSEQMYEASAKLVKYLAAKYNVPLDRMHILGHDNVPGESPYGQSVQHWDPAAYWNWNHFFDLLGASFKQADGQNTNSKIVTIDVNYNTNTPPLTYAGSSLTPQPSDFVYLYSAPSFSAPLVSDPALHPNGSPGTTAINDWGDKAVDGQSFYVAGQQGDWTSIYYGGQVAWFYNPKGVDTVAGKGLLVTPKAGDGSIPVYGSAYPQSVGGNTPLQYTIPAGQVYVASGPVGTDYYGATTYNNLANYQVVKGTSKYYEISFNHRVAFVKASDVTVVNNSASN